MLKLFTTPALSAYRCQQISRRIAEITPTYTHLNTRFVHFIDSQKLDDVQIQTLRYLLEDGDKPPIFPTGSHNFLVTPRPATISPWSSKATEIIHRCGLTSIRRIERGIEFAITCTDTPTPQQIAAIKPLLHDRMTEIVSSGNADLFASSQPKPLQTVAILEKGIAALTAANENLGLALSLVEITYLYDNFLDMGRNPTDAELMMFAQANSEHCRHKIFNANWTINGKPQPLTLLQMIQNTARKSPQGILSAYSDNSAVAQGSEAQILQRHPKTGVYAYHNEAVQLLMKVETHNHPTAISPNPGAATGSGGEIRDEAATGRGSTSKAGFSGYSVSHLNIPKHRQSWEIDCGKPAHIACALDIMLQAPIGSAAFNNEFGRPAIAGYFRSFQSRGFAENEYFGYHKPIMLAGGLGNIRPMLVQKNTIPDGSLLLVLGGSAMLIGLGGGAASSKNNSTENSELDFASVQRADPQMQRRCQEVINHCNALGQESPIISIHDVGAGGLSNAAPEIIHDCRQGGSFALRDIPCADNAMSPMQIWCNEAQERYVLAISPQSLPLFAEFCQREQCQYAVIGTAKNDEHLTVHDSKFAGNAIDIDMSVLFGKPPQMHKKGAYQPVSVPDFDPSTIDLSVAVASILSFPSVADKSFLIHIGDRSVGGLVAQQQMVGRWQIPVADAGVTACGFQSTSGEALAIGERSPLAIINPQASARMAIGECLTNIACANIASINKVKISANWMAACGSEQEDGALFAAVEAVGMQLCPALGIAIPVGKDSLSMQSTWSSDNTSKTVRSPLSLLATAFAPVLNIGKTLTPQLQTGDSVLLLLDLGGGQNRLGGSVLAQTQQQIGNNCPDLDDPAIFKAFFTLIQQLNSHNKLLAYHDRSDGGLLAVVCEMIFASRIGAQIKLDNLLPKNAKNGDILAALCNEELGAVVQIKADNLPDVLQRTKQAGLGDYCHIIGKTTPAATLAISQQGKVIYQQKRAYLQKIWSTVSWQMQKLRDNPDCADQQFASIADDNDRGLWASLAFDPTATPTKYHSRPKIAILREQGVNGQQEMAAAFDRAGFSAVDVHTSDIIRGKVTLADFAGMAVCGGFSYGDVLGAGRGWAKSILLNATARGEFGEFFRRPEVFALGVCNGCQMMAGLKEIIPGSNNWPTFHQNTSNQFEARTVMVKINQSPSILLQGMAGSYLPVVSAHAEGRAQLTTATDKPLVALSFVDGEGVATQQFPANPNGSPQGITGFCNEDGRFTIMMPHPERCFRTVQNPWSPSDWGEDGGWMRMFYNARDWVAGHNRYQNAK